MNVLIWLNETLWRRRHLAAVLWQLSTATPEPERKCVECIILVHSFYYLKITSNIILYLRNSENTFFLHNKIYFIISNYVFPWNFRNTSIKRKLSDSYLFIHLGNNMFRKGGNHMNKALDCFALTIVIIGAINWGLIGFFRFDLVAAIFGNMSWVSRIIYDLVGICGLYLITFYMYCCGGRNQTE